MNWESALLVIGIGVKFPFLSYRASANCQLKASIHEKLSICGRTEESIRQRDGIYFGHRRIVDKVWVDEEENWHIYGLPSVEPLLFEAEALNLAEIWSYLSWSNTIGSNPNDVLSTSVRRCIKREGCLSR